MGMSGGMSGGIPATLAPARPFLGWPVVTDPEGWAGAAAAVIGLPHGEPYPGEPFPNVQAGAPEAIRAQSGQFCDGPERFDFDLGATLESLLPGGGIDAGNAPFPGPDRDAAFAANVARIGRLLGTGALLAVLGGDHGVTIPVLHALAIVGRPVHIVQIDAHLDWRDEVGGVRRGYSSPMRRASELPHVSGLTQIGLRGTGSARLDEHRAAQARGADLVTAEAVHRDGVAPVLARLAGRGPFWLTIDADGLDPAAMPGVMAPAPGGLTVPQVLAIIRGLARDGPLLGLDLVEVAPAFDLANGITAITAGRLVLNALGHARRATAGSSGAAGQKTR
jgi:agmatinase